MSSEVPIVDCGPFCAVGFSRTIDKSEFSHSLGRLLSCRESAQERTLAERQSLPASNCPPWASASRMTSSHGHLTVEKRR